MALDADRFDRSLWGIRYIPGVSIHCPVFGRWTATAEWSGHFYGSGGLDGGGRFMESVRIKSYRLWIRLAAAQFEARFGLQKINFGSAALIRPLMWFDRVDARDPLQLTDGVVGLLVRYTFLNNANVWCWGLYGNNGVKGWESIPSTRHDPEFGGRVQVPVPKGEVALSMHHRRMDVPKTFMDFIPSVRMSAPEDRFAVDGKWDVGVGVWGEAVWSRQQLGIPSVSHQRFVNAGMDYTFGIGSGLHVLSEYFAVVISDRAWGPGESISFSALSVDCPLGLLDNLTVLAYADWENRGWYRFFSWQRKYDNWSFYLIGFWNPERFRVVPGPGERNWFAGRGMQLMAVWNH